MKTMAEIIVLVACLSVLTASVHSEIARETAFVTSQSSDASKLPASSSEGIPENRVAIRFGAMGERIVVPHSNSLNNTGAMTIELWVRPQTIAGNPASYPNLIGKRDTNGTFPTWCLGLGPKRQPYTVANGAWHYGSRSLKVETWSHVAMVFDGESVRFFINGEAGAKFPTKQLGPANTQQVIVGTLLGETQNFAGDIGPVRVSTVARYSKNFKPTTRWKPDKTTVLLFHLDKKTRTIKDRSGQDNHGKVTGDVEWLETPDMNSQAKQRVR